MALSDAHANPEKFDNQLVLLVGNGKILRKVGDEELLFSLDSLASLINFQTTISHVIGHWHSARVSVLQLAAADIQRISKDYEFISLRALLGEIQSDLFQLLGAGLQWLNWYTNHQYCGRCGVKNTLFDEGRALHCEACNLTCYPRISPCVIGLVIKEDQCLLAHHTKYKTHRFSTLAGFIEPGESAEQAFAREVREEVGIQVRNIRYIKSQPWPFPGQLMLGFSAEWLSGEIEVDGEEIDEAYWFDFDNLPELPPKGALSREIIEYVKQEKAT